MIVCGGTPAELHALQYVEGTLSEFEAARFEEHFFGCPVCLRHLQAIQAVAQELARQPIAPIQAPPRTPLAWPVRVWAMGAIAALLLIGVSTYMSLESKPAHLTVAQSQPKPIPQAESAHAFTQPVHLSQLADLTLPSYVAPNLRGESLNGRFETGMRAYANGNCRAAIEDLSRIPAESAEARAAQL
ncbi:MAG TPA: zf-HC2 domain-containing protein, partial [Terracidiphilus sp.]